MRLAQIIQQIGLAELPSALSDLEINAVTEDSRRVQTGTLFVAVKGEHADGNDFISKAVEYGAVAVFSDREGPDTICGVPCVHVDKPRKIVGELAHKFAGSPSEHMKVIGITGTNGKSSSVLLTQHVLNHAGHKTASLGTLGYDLGGEVSSASHTTPFGEDLAKLFEEAKETGHTHVVMEVSSHSIDQDRIAGIDFDVAAFTNLTQDHLDYHKSMESYRDVKTRFFKQIKGDDKFTVVNNQDPSAEDFIRASSVKCCKFGKGGDIEIAGLEIELRSTLFLVTSIWGDADIELPLVGKHNVQNALCAISICCGMGLPLDKVAQGLACFDKVPGRFEQIDAGQDFQVIVDYAHTEDGLRNVLDAARAICKGRVIVVFGCGGDRDREKRPKMGAAAAELADFSIITTDNPRTEYPQKIIDEIEVGLIDASKKAGDDYMVVPDRASAIRKGLKMAQSGDLVLIAGKGHEDYQIFGTERIHFDDREMAAQILQGTR